MHAVSETVCSNRGACAMKRELVDLNLLVALDALLKERNVTKAAARLGVGQPAMSASLARLRRVFDDPLLVRSGRAFALTPLAQLLVQPNEAVLGDIESVLALRPGFDAASDTHTFTIVGSDYVAFILLRHLVPALYAEAPKVTIRIRPLAEGFKGLSETIQRGEADVLIVPAEFDRSLRRFRHRRLFEDRFVCVAWEGNPEIGDTLTIDEFSRLPHLGQFGGLPETRLQQLGIDRNVEIMTQNFLMGPMFVRGTRLLAIVHRKVALELAPEAAARVLEMPVDLGVITETMYWHPRRENDLPHRWLRDRISTLAAEL
jgi:DNA-binding transcriptional LysR family regulator